MEKMSKMVVFLGFLIIALFLAGCEKTEIDEGKGTPIETSPVIEPQETATVPEQPSEQETQPTIPPELEKPPMPPMPPNS